jgi:hypothetical protein
MVIQCVSEEEETESAYMLMKFMLKMVEIQYKDTHFVIFWRA